MDEFGCMTISEEGVDNAERFRVLGNDAFAAFKWNEAVHFYRKSISCEGESKLSSKVYSNLAATLCKLSQYSEADIEAQSAIDRDPKWGKAWWRKGTVRELQKDFLGALRNYEKATELDPNQRTYQNDKARMMQKIGDNHFLWNQGMVAATRNHGLSLVRSRIAMTYQRVLPGSDFFPQVMELLIIVTLVG